MDEFEKYRNNALRFLSFRPRSEKEVRENLVKKKAPPEVVERIILSLKEHKFINDNDFASWFIEQRLRFKPKSIRLITVELQQKGIKREIIEQAFIDLQKDDSRDVSSNDLDSAIQLVEKRIAKYKHLDKQDVYNKLGSYLARRGFGWDTIKKSIDDVLKDRV
jgi:regulatory protein